MTIYVTITITALDPLDLLELTLVDKILVAAMPVAAAPEPPQAMPQAERPADEAEAERYAEQPVSRLKRPTTSTPHAWAERATGL